MDKIAARAREFMATLTLLRRDLARGDRKLALACLLVLLSGALVTLWTARKEGLLLPGYTIRGDQLVWAILAVLVLMFAVALLLWRDIGSSLWPGEAVAPVQPPKIQPPPDVIKGLRPYERRDAAIFMHLERRSSIGGLCAAITSDHFGLGVLTGRMGSGKTSLLKAGVRPVVEERYTDFLCIYSKIDGPDAEESVRASIRDQVPDFQPQNADADLPTLLEAASRATGKRIILLIDQFEQFFVHTQQSERADHPFVSYLARWNRGVTPVRALLAVRGDYLDRVTELEQLKQIEAIPRYNYLTLEKFTPGEAKRVLQTLAMGAGIRYDEPFLGQLGCELADREDGRVSPTRLQIVAWRMASLEEEHREFSRRALQRLGGADGVFTGFLRDSLSPFAPGDRDLVVRLLALLVLGNTRAGQRSPAEIVGMLGGESGVERVPAVLERLCKDDIQLVSGRKRGSEDVYELAHEWLIPAIRAQSERVKEPERLAERLLDQRVNEWVGNDRATRFLLRERELRQIERHVRPLSQDDPLRESKQELIHASRRRAARGRLYRYAAMGLLLVLVAGVASRDQTTRLSFASASARRLELGSGTVLILDTIRSLKGRGGGEWRDNLTIPVSIRRKVLADAGVSSPTVEQVLPMDSVRWREFLSPPMHDTTREKILNRAFVRFRLIVDGKEETTFANRWYFESDTIADARLPRIIIVEAITRDPKSADLKLRSRVRQRIGFHATPGPS